MGMNDTRANLEMIVKVDRGRGEVRDVFQLCLDG